MLLTVAYGIFALFFEGKARKITPVSATKELADLNTFITKVAQASKAGLSTEDKYIIQRAEAKWEQDPLTSAELKDRPESELQKKKKVTQDEGPQLDVSYSGFLKMGSKKYAIIDGVEYAAGDSLNQGGYIVRSITPRQVVIVSTERGNKKFIFPLEE